MALTVQGKVNRSDGYIYFSLSEFYPVARTLTWRGVADPADGCIKVWDDRDYIPGWPFWRRAFVNRSTGKIELQVPRYEQMNSAQFAVYSGFGSRPDGGGANYAAAQDEAYANFLAAVGRTYEDAFKHGDTDGLNGTCRCWFRSGYRPYTFTAAAKAGALDAKFLVAGKHYYRIYDGNPPTMDRVDSGQVTFDWNEGPYDMYASGQDFVNRHVPDTAVAMPDFNDTWAASGRPWNGTPDSACYRTIAIPPAFLTAMSSTVLYVWFLLSSMSFPWRHGTIGTTEDLGIFFGGFWVLC